MYALSHVCLQIFFKTKWEKTFTLIFTNIIRNLFPFKVTLTLLCGLAVIWTGRCMLNIYNVDRQCNLFWRKNFSLQNLCINVIPGLKLSVSTGLKRLVGVQTMQINKPSKYCALKCEQRSMLRNPSAELFISFSPYTLGTSGRISNHTSLKIRGGKI